MLYIFLWSVSNAVAPGVAWTAPCAPVSHTHRPGSIPSHHANRQRQRERISYRSSYRSPTHPPITTPQLALDVASRLTVREQHVARAQVAVHKSARVAVLHGGHELVGKQVRRELAGGQR